MNIPVTDHSAFQAAINDVVNDGVELEPFVRLIEALEPWPDHVVVIGGWPEYRVLRLSVSTGGPWFLSWQVRSTRRRACAPPVKWLSRLSHTA
jgi:hypothetical protein